MTELLKNGLGHLMCFRHPKLLHVVHGPEENSDTLAFASEPLIGSLANILNSGMSGSIDNGEKQSNSNNSMLKIDYSFIDVEYRYGFSQVSIPKLWWYKVFSGDFRALPDFLRKACF